MKNLTLIFPFLLLFNCSSYSPQKEEEESIQETSQGNEKEIISAIDASSFSSFRELTAGKDLSQSSKLHNYLASQCNQKPRMVYQQMAEDLITRGAKPVEESYTNSSHQQYKAPLLSAIENGCPWLLEVYLENMSKEDIAKASLDLSALDFITFTERIIDKEPLTQELSHLEETPLSVDIAIGKNSELCLDNEKNCQARDHLLKEYQQMREAVANYAYYKACSTQIDLINKVQLMREQIEFGKLTGTASPQTYDTHASQAQDLRAWYRYYQGLFFKTTGEEANLSQCIL